MLFNCKVKRNVIGDTVVEGNIDTAVLILIEHDYCVGIQDASKTRITLVIPSCQNSMNKDWLDKYHLLRYCDWLLFYSRLCII